MSVDTRAARNILDEGMNVGRAIVEDMCDEIDRLRKDAHDAKYLYSLSNGAFQEENERLRAELAELRDRQRPKILDTRV